MSSIVLYFQVHQPYRLREYTLFDVGDNADYFDDIKNRAIIERVSKDCYLPANAILSELAKRYEGAFKFAFSITGVVLDQLEAYAPEVIQSFQEIAQTGHVEFIGETYYHSLASLFSRDEFKEQIKLHRKKMKDLFGQIPTTFRNTELIYSNWMGKFIEDLGFKGTLIEGAEQTLEKNTPNKIYRAVGTKSLGLLPRNYRLSDDIAFRFNTKTWDQYPLTAPKFAAWLSAVKEPEAVINIFLDYETFGEHQKEATGIFEFLRTLPDAILAYKKIEFQTPAEALSSHPFEEQLDIPNYLSWADMERDLSSWLGNMMQLTVSKELYDFETDIMKSKDTELVNLWRKLTTSDHYYYMSTKHLADGEIHQYFNPYDSPYEAYIYFKNILRDIQRRVSEMKKTTKAKTKPAKALHPEAYREASSYEKCFFLQNGTVVKNVAELADALNKMDDDTFVHHVSKDKNDFANWVSHVFNMGELAEKIRKASTRTGMARVITGYFSK